MEYKSIFVWFTTVVGFVLSYLGGYDKLLSALVFFVVCDYVTGLMKAMYKKKLDPDIGYRGILKKLGMFVAIAIAYRLDILFETDTIRASVIGGYIGVEVISAVRNLVSIKVFIPKALRPYIEKLKDKDPS